MTWACEWYFWDCHTHVLCTRLNCWWLAEIEDIRQGNGGSRNAWFQLPTSRVHNFSWLTFSDRHHGIMAEDSCQLHTRAAEMLVSWLRCLIAILHDSSAEWHSCNMWAESCQWLNQEKILFCPKDSKDWWVDIYHKHVVIRESLQHIAKSCSVSTKIIRQCSIFCSPGSDED